ncbi:hypothetical protein Patl1_21199 [Pistacia atlantica]|uniref:Uncharacterized protein n=1 Tax=Pistacia atlantica TaxID=434234 RepID=A0ACC1BNZ2_9ROSI|nr:hypothetical protein Patl1_21199 [Pistacia atlantica]
MALLTDLINLNLSESTDKIIAEYIWIGGSGMDLRSKARTLNGPVSDPSKLPKWNYDGSSTGQAPGEDTLKLFSRIPSEEATIFLLCVMLTILLEYQFQQTRDVQQPRSSAILMFLQKSLGMVLNKNTPLLQKDVKWPLGWPVGGYPGPQGPYYCGVGADKAWGRDIVDSHYKACLYAGINISGINGEVMPGQWEFQVGPAVGISAADELWVARYILERITEIAGVVLTFDPKPIQGDWNGAGAHTNYSTKSMRKEGGFEVIKKAIEKLGKKHKEHIAAYGEGNERRLTGRHETADINTFKWFDFPFILSLNRVWQTVVPSVRVGRDTQKEGKGYFEDRRPASNMDPYVVTSMIAKTTILSE